MHFTKLVVSIARGASPAKVVDDVTEAQSSSVLFVVRSTDLEECEVVAKTIANLFNGFIHNFPSVYEPTHSILRKHRDWSADEQDSECTHYVYAYASPQDYQDWKGSEPSYRNDLSNHHVFYIGRGQNQRLADHISEAKSGLISHFPKRKTAAIEIGKLKKIQDFVFAEWESIASKMVRKVAKFYGPYAVAQFAASEYFLINHWCGVYNLENLTRGDTRVKGSSCEWFSIPKSSRLENDRAQNLISHFKSSGLQAVTQGLKRELIINEVNSEFKKFPLSKLLTQVRGLTVESEKAIQNGKDAFYPLVLNNHIGTPLILIQLKLSDKYSGVCINLRRLKGDALTVFIKRVAQIFFAGAEDTAALHIKDIKTDPYFKPCAPIGKSGKDDIWFDLRRPDDPEYDIAETALALAAKEAANQSLYGALSLISGLAKSIG